MRVGCEGAVTSSLHPSMRADSSDLWQAPSLAVSSCLFCLEPCPARGAARPAGCRSVCTSMGVKLAEPCNDCC